MKMTDRTILVTGATGNTGSRVVSRLTALGHTVKAAGRRPTAQGDTRAVRFDWYDPDTFGEALHGSSGLYLVPPIGDPAPAAVMVPFFEQARAAGVRRAVLLSSSAIPAGGPGVGQVYDVLADVFDEWAILRPSWFMQNFTDHHPHADSIRDDGVIMTATGKGRVGFVDADDIAAVAVHALTDGTAPNTDLVITGPHALSYDDIAATITQVTSRSVTHQPLTYEQMRDRLATHMPKEFAEMLAGMDRAIAEGAEDRITDTVERVTGRPARSFRQYVEKVMV
jgi:uncharacterized protein YbjT (DUF2867 family)